MTISNDFNSSIMFVMTFCTLTLPITIRINLLGFAVLKHYNTHIDPPRPLGSFKRSVQSQKTC